MQKPWKIKDFGNSIAVGFRGNCGCKATSSLLSRKAKQYPTHYGSSRTRRYRQDIANREVVCDCIGGGQAMLNAIGTDKSVPGPYGAHGCPDKGANSMLSCAKSKDCAWGADGSFGPETLSALKTFQRKADGIYGTEPHAALMAETADREGTVTPSEPENGEKTPDITGRQVTVSCVSGTVNIRPGRKTPEPMTRCVGH